LSSVRRTEGEGGNYLDERVGHLVGLVLRADPLQNGVRRVGVVQLGDGRVELFHKAGAVVDEGLVGAQGFVCSALELIQDRLRLWTRLEHAAEENIEG